MAQDRTTLEHANMIGKLTAEIEGLRSQQKTHADQMQRDNMTMNVKIDSIFDKIDLIFEYINTQKGQKIAIVAFASIIAMFGTAMVEWISKKFS